MTTPAEIPNYRADAPVSSADASETGTYVVFYQLCRKFVDDERSVPDEHTDEIMYYTLAVGHHTGVIDCFEERLRCPMEQYEAVCSLFDDETARYKMEGIVRSGEIQIEHTHVSMLAPQARKAMESLRKKEGDEAAAERKWLKRFVEMLDLLAADKAAYIMGRKRVS